MLPSPKQLAQDPDFLNAAPEVQNATLSRVDPDFANASPEVQQAVLGKLTAGVSRTAPNETLKDWATVEPSPLIPEPVQDTIMDAASSVNKALGGVNKAVAKPLAASQAVIDPFMNALSFGVTGALMPSPNNQREAEAKVYGPEFAQELEDIRNNPILNTIGDLGGLVGPVSAFTKGVKLGLTKLGRKTPNALKGVSNEVAKGTLKGRAAVDAAAFGGYEGLRAIPETLREQYNEGQFNPAEVAKQSGLHALRGAALGGAFPYAEKGLGKVAKPLITQAKNIAKPIMQRLERGSIRQGVDDLLKGYGQMEQTVKEAFETGDIDPASFMKPNALHAGFARNLEKLRKFAATGEGQPTKAQLRGMARVLERFEQNVMAKSKSLKAAKEQLSDEPLKAGVRKDVELPAGKQADNVVMKDGIPMRPIGVEPIMDGTPEEIITKELERAKIKDKGEAKKALEAKVPGRSDVKLPDTQDPKKLEAQNQKMFESAADLKGKVERGEIDLTKDGHLIGDAQKFLERAEKAANGKLKPTQYNALKTDIEWVKGRVKHAELKTKLDNLSENMKDVLRTEFDAETGVGMQRAINSGRQKTYEDVKYLLDGEDRAIGDVLKQAAQQDKQVRLPEYIAEEAGHTSTFREKTITPLSFNASEKGVRVSGLNEEGHIAEYYITKSEAGSKITQMPEILDVPGKRGIYPNVYKGPREYNLEDVLRRPQRMEPVKDSVMTAQMEQVQQIFKTMGDATMPKSVRDFGNMLQKLENIDAKTMNQLKKYMKDKRLKKVVCDILGLTHG